MKRKLIYALGSILALLALASSIQVDSNNHKDTPAEVIFFVPSPFHEKVETQLNSIEINYDRSNKGAIFKIRKNRHPI